MLCTVQNKTKDHLWTFSFIWLMTWIFFFNLLVFENKDKIVIVMEYASRGDLYDYICDKRNISEREARHFFRQIVSAVHYCHQVRLSV